jgi:small nuclear ribonucleoprotein
LVTEKRLPDLARFLNREVVIAAKGGLHIVGTLLSYDEHMNLLLADAEIRGESKRRLVVVKGGNVYRISLK